MSLTQAKPCPISNVDFTPGADESPWYAAYTLPRHEKAVAEHLAFFTLAQGDGLGDAPWYSYRSSQATCSFASRPASAFGSWNIQACFV